MTAQYDFLREPKFRLPLTPVVVIRRGEFSQEQLVDVSVDGRHPVDHVLPALSDQVQTCLLDQEK